MENCKKDCVMRLLIGPQTEEGRKFEDGELIMCIVDRQPADVLDIGYCDEVICSTTQEPAEGDVVALTLENSPQDKLYCAVYPYCEETRDFVGDSKVLMLGVVVQHRRDPFYAEGDDLKFRDFTRAEIAEVAAG